MFDILLYLYDTYLLSEHFPDPERLSRKLSAAGFEDQAIGEALDWLAALEDLSPDEGEVEHPAARVYSNYEISRMATEGRGFLTFLEGSGDVLWLEDLVRGGEDADPDDDADDSLVIGWQPTLH